MKLAATAVAAAAVAAGALLLPLGFAVGLPKLLVWIPAWVALAAALVACRDAARRAAGDLRPFWTGMSATVAFILLAAVSQAVDVLTLPFVGVAPFSSRTMLLYVVGVGIGVLALARLSAGYRTWRQRVTAVLDVAVVAVVAGMAGAEYLHWFLDGFGSVTAAVRLNGAVLAISVAGVILIVKAMTVRHPRLNRRAWAFLAPVCAAGPLSALLMAALRDWPHLNGSAAVLPAAGLFFALAAKNSAAAAPARAAAAPTSSIAASRRSTAVPLIASVLASALLVAVYTSSGRLSGALVAGAAALLVLVVARQAVALIENGRLLDIVVHQATHDELTGLHNRRRLAEAVTAATGPRTVVLLDLNGFRAVNESMGTAAGDMVLTAVATRLTRIAGERAVVARLGGDEFGLLLPGPAASTALARLIEAGHEPLHLDGHDVLIDMSAGVAEGDDRDAGDLYRRAAIALRAAMSPGATRLVTYDETLEQQVTCRADIAVDLRRALTAGEFHLVYQPIVELPHGRVAGVESLLRWTRADGTTVPPSDFIPIAEDSGLIVELGAWIIDRACAQAAAWDRRHGPDAVRSVSVNVSARQLLDVRLPEVVAAALTRHGLDPSRLTVEITETAVFGGGPALATVHALAGLGVGIALDDFGTGHSSLSLLRTCPVTTIKVDKSFVDGVDGTPQQEAIVAALAGMATTMGLRTVAEGVETAAQAARLFDLGYRRAQGFHFARPQPPEAIDALLAVTAAA